MLCRKGYLIPEDIMAMFDAIGRKITLNEIENSFKYAKVFKNKMSFEDFKEYYNNFWLTAYLRIFDDITKCKENIY